jgi:hypothetical protein
MAGIAPRGCSVNLEDFVEGDLVPQMTPEVSKLLDRALSLSVDEQAALA